jgi:XTP/dITP diphosphohydrolase
MLLCFATNNPGKLKEIQAMLKEGYTLSGLKDIGCDEDIPETEETLEGNSHLKAAHVWNKYKVSCFADDTGLEVEALEGAPGVYSARYAGSDCDPEKNMDLLLKNLQGKTNRQARFRSVITLILEGKEYQFDGVVEGEILMERKGNQGFGYDPIFRPEAYEKSFAEMTIEEKNKISHRGRAVQKLIDFLNNKS